MPVETSEKTEADGDQSKTNKVKRAVFAHFSNCDAGNNSEVNGCNGRCEKFHSRCSWRCFQYGLKIDKEVTHDPLRDDRAQKINGID